MTNQQRAVHSFRFEQHANELVLVVTASIESELVVENFNLGAIEPGDLAAAMDAALRELQEHRGAALVSAA